MVSSIWSNTLLKDEIKKGKKVNIKHKIPTEETHELAIDIYETENRVFVVAPLAGVKSSDLEISVDESTIFIEGIRKNPFEDHSEFLYSSECFWGRFERKFTLPSFVDTRDMTATFRNGILLIEAVRIAPSGVKRIKIN